MLYLTPMPTDVLLLFCTCPDRSCADQIAQEIVGRKLAACVNISGPTISVYRWEGKPESDQEFTMAVKTTRARYHALESAICELHPYELPEIIAVPVVQGLSGYLQWVDQCTTEK